MLRYLTMNICQRNGLPSEGVERVARADPRQADYDGKTEVVNEQAAEAGGALPAALDAWK